MSTSTEIWIDGVLQNGGYSRYSGPAIPDDVAERLVEWDWGGSWEFEMLVIYKAVNSTEIRAAVDSGCSCPTPFSDLTWDAMRRVNSVDDVLSLFNAKDEWDENFVAAPPDTTLADITSYVHRYLRDNA